MHTTGCIYYNKKRFDCHLVVIKCFHSSSVSYYGQSKRNSECQSIPTPYIEYCAEASRYSYLRLTENFRRQLGPQCFSLNFNVYLKKYFSFLIFLGYKISYFITNISHIMTSCVKMVTFLCDLDWEFRGRIYLDRCWLAKTDTNWAG